MAENRIGIKGRTVELFVRFLDAIGNPTQTDDIPEVKIIDSQGHVQQDFTNLGVMIVDKDTATYKLSYEIPLNSPDSYWSDQWRAEIGGEEVINGFAFLVTSSGVIEEDVEPVYDPGDDVPYNFTKEEVYGMNVLLKLMKPRLKNDGIRKIPDGMGGYTEQPCPVFKNSELISFLVSGLSEFNQIPHFTSYTFADQPIYTIFADVVIQGGILLALAAQALIEKGREFTITDNGISYQPPQISEILNNQYTQQLADYKEKVKYIKANMKPGPLSISSFRITAISPNFTRLRHLREKSLF